MINFNVRKLDFIVKNVIKYKTKGKLTLCDNLSLDLSVDKKDGYLSIALYYKDNNIKDVHFFYDKDDLNKNTLPILTDINNLFQSFIKELNNYIEDDDYANICQYLTFIIQKEMLTKCDELFIQTLDDITIISVQYDDKNREIWMMYLNEDEVIQFTGEILYTFENSKYDTYNPYDFMFRNMLFLGNPKYNKLSTELIYVLQ